jgi:acyl-CoA synthetase (AMP-forming)/AMP-acid ligase II
MQLVRARWSDRAREKIRLFANTGGHVPRTLLAQLRALFPNASPFLMYGLTEAFRSTYLDPAEVDRRPDSIGKAVPNAEIFVLRENGEECEPDEVGELVHRGAFVTLGYWNGFETSAKRFRRFKAPGSPYDEELAVWSGDLVRKDAEGFLYFVGRKDDLIKTSGYRVSPTEVEEAIFQSGVVSEVAVFGVPHAELGEAIVACVVPIAAPLPTAALLEHCRRELPTYMVPRAIECVTSLPRNPNGKIDRGVLKRGRSGVIAAEAAGTKV